MNYSTLSTADHTVVSHLPFGYYKPRGLLVGLMWLTRHCPNHWLGRRLATMLRQLALQLTGSPVDIQVDSIKLRSYLHDNVSERRFVFTAWQFDSEERALVRRELPRNGVFIDIGANVGLYTLTAARALGKEGIILAFEPYPPAFERLVFNISINFPEAERSPRIIVLPLGVNDKAGTVDLHLDPRNLGGNSLKASSGGRRAIIIECVSLLQALEHQGIKHINILKIDIEGAEVAVLKPFLNQAPPSLLPDYLIIEVSKGSGHADLVSMLDQRGYKEVLRTRMNGIYCR